MSLPSRKVQLGSFRKGNLTITARTEIRVIIYRRFPNNFCHLTLIFSLRIRTDLEQTLVIYTNIPFIVKRCWILVEIALYKSLLLL